MSGMVHPMPFSLSSDSRTSISRSHESRSNLPRLEYWNESKNHGQRVIPTRLMTTRTMGLRLLFFCLNVYTIASFVLTSSTLYPFWPASVAFLDDLRNGLYTFESRTQIDRVMLEEMNSECAIMDMNLMVLGYQDHHHNALGSASHCYRLGVDKGTSVVITYYDDAVARRSIHKFHGALPNSCTGYTVPTGQPYDSNERIFQVNDARKVIGQSYLYCTDPVLSMTEQYDPTLQSSHQLNNTEFTFKASYVIVQQHFANAYFGIECQVNYCIARQVKNAPGFWEVQSADPDDTRAYVNVLFTPKPLLLDLLSVFGQALIWFAIIREIWRATLVDNNVKVPTKRPPNNFQRRQTHWLGLSKSPAVVNCTYLDAGASRLSFSRVWLSNPLYMIGNVAHALGTTVESQMAVEVLYWQYTKSGRTRDLLYAGIYSMRHAWVGLALCSILRLVLDALLRVTPHKNPLWSFQHASNAGGLAVNVGTCMFRHLRSVLLYVSAKSYILAFSIAAIVTVRGRGILFLWGLREIPDLGAGTTKSSFWGSEVAHSLFFHHSLALVIVYFVALSLRTICRSAWPTHERNSLMRVLDHRMWWTSFDVADFLLTTASVEDETGQILFVARLSEIYQLFSTLRVFGPQVYFQFTDDKVDSFTHNDVVNLSMVEDNEGGMKLQARQIATYTNVKVPPEHRKMKILTIR